jgi:hypothetical protein
VPFLNDAVLHNTAHNKPRAQQSITSAKTRRHNKKVSQRSAHTKNRKNKTHRHIKKASQRSAHQHKIKIKTDKTEKHADTTKRPHNDERRQVTAAIVAATPLAVNF